MGIFSKGKSGGAMNVIRCDLEDYLVWKWRPLGQDANATTRENSIRWGSSLRVKDGEVAVFVYKQKDDTMQDFIEGPFDQTIKTSNFPILTSILGMAYGGESPFQAEVYFINKASTIQVKFGVPYFDVVDPRFLDFGVPVSAGGTLTFAVDDIKDFIKKNRLVDFSLDRLREKIKDMVVRRCKGVIANAPTDQNIPVFQIERRIDDINDAIEAKLKRDLEDFGVNLRRMDLSRLSLDKESDGWRELRSVTADLQSRTMNAQTDVNIKNLEDQQNINAENMRETMRMNREATARAQRLQTESQYIQAHALDQQASVLRAGAENLGNMSAMGGSGGMNPAGMMVGMAMGQQMGQQMGSMMNGMNQNMNPGMNPAMGGMTPPPMPGAAPQPNVMFMVAVNGQQAGPFTVIQLQQLVANGQFNAQSMVWRQGMAAWTAAGQVPELMGLFVQAQPQVAPPMPGMPGAGTPMPPPIP